MEKSVRVKQKRCMMNYERFSELPEPLIIHILSFLDMKDVVKTSVLSKMWEHLWTQVDSLVFDWVNQKRGDNLEEFLKFIAYVDKTLMKCTCPNINKFVFSINDFDFGCPGTVDISKPLVKWLEFLVNKNVKFLKLGVGLIFKGPHGLYHNSSLEILELDGLYDYYRTDSISWPLLKCLSLKDVRFEKEIMAKLFWGCPMLERLVLDNIRGMMHLNISSPRLKILKLLNLQYEDSFYVPDDVDFDGILKIQVPFVQELEIAGHFVWIQCQLVDVSSLKYANFTFNYSDGTSELEIEKETFITWRKMVNGMLKCVWHVNELVLGSDFIEAMSLSRIFDGPLKTFKCKHLAVHSPHTFRIYEIPGLIYLFGNMPHLETLVLEMSPLSVSESGFYIGIPPWYDRLIPHYKKDFSFDGAEYLMFQSGNFQHLKNVKIDYVKHVCPDRDSECFEYELIAYILRNAPILEKLVILPSKSSWLRSKYKWPTPTDRSSQYSSLMSSESMVGNKAGQWVVKTKDPIIEFTFF